MSKARHFADSVLKVHF